MDQKCLLIDALEAFPAGLLLEQNHAEAPPVGSGGDTAKNRFGGCVARGLQRRDNVQVEIRQAGGTEARHHQIERIASANEYCAGTQISVAQAVFRKTIQRSTDLLSDS